MSQSTATIIHKHGRKDAPVCLSINHAREVLDALQWVVDDWDNMDADDKATHKGYLDAYNSILDQLPMHKDVYGEYEIIEHDGYTVKHYIASGTLHSIPKDIPTYPEPEGDPSY